MKHHTIILVPHTRARFRKWRVSNRQLLVATTIVIALIALSCFTTWSFLTNSIDKHQLAKLEAENQKLREVNREFESSIRELKTRLTDFEDRTRQLAIVAGLDGAAVEQESGIGGEDTVLASGSALTTLDFDHRLRSLVADLDAVESRLDERWTRISSTPTISPVKGLLTSGYGQRIDPITGQTTDHRALDLSTSPGQPVVATADGIVVRAERSGRLGKAVFISHGFGLTTRYGHLADISVAPGKRVKRGEVIGSVGNTGRTTGFHLHYEVRLDGRPVNPLGYILDSTPQRY